MAAVAALLFLLLAAPAAALNITKVLEPFPDFSTFSSLLNQTSLAAQINSRSTVTILVVDNGAAGQLSSLNNSVLQHVLAVHVILDYYDEKKLHQISKKSAIVTTLFQSSGVAVHRTGFLNVTDLSDGSVGFGSASAGAGLTANFVKEVVTHPYIVSVIQVSSIIYPPGISDINSTPSSPPPPPAVNTPTPAPAPSKSHGLKSSPRAEKASPPAPPADAPADAPDADSLSADAPVADKNKSSAGRVTAGGFTAAMVAAFLAAL